MKVLAFNGSPRKGGNTEVLLAAVMDGMASAGGKGEIVRVCDLRIQPCIGCGGCEKEGKCVLDDDMTGLYEKIIVADRLVMASPIYFYGITAQAKACVDRMQALWSRKRLLTEKGDWQEDPGRKGFLVSIAATWGEKVFDGAILTMKYACDAVGASYGGEFLVRGVDRRGEMAKQAAELDKAREAGRRFML